MRLESNRDNKDKNPETDESRLTEFVSPLRGNLSKILQWPYSKNVKRLEIKLKYLFGYFSKLVIFMTGLLIFVSSAKGVFEQNYTIIPFEVPAAFSEDGVNGNFVVWELSEKMLALQKSGWSTAGLHIITQREKIIEKDLVLFGISLNTVKSLIRQGLGVSNKTITGILVNQQGRLILKLAISSNKTIVIEQNENNFKDIYSAYNALIESAAQALIKEIEPFILVSHYWAVKDTTKSLQHIDYMIQSDNKSIDSAYLIWGKILIEQGQSALAMSKFKAAVELNPKNNLAWQAWGLLLFRKADYSLAIEKFKKALVISPTSWQPTHLWAKALARSGLHQDAISKFKKAIELAPDKYNSYNEISYEYSTLGDHNSSIKYLLKGIEKNTNSALLHATLAEMYWTINNREKALESLNNAANRGFDIEPHKNIEPYQTFHKNIGKKITTLNPNMSGKQMPTSNRELDKD